MIAAVSVCLTGKTGKEIITMFEEDKNSGLYEMIQETFSMLDADELPQTAQALSHLLDENNTEDPDVVTENNYIGKTVFALPKVGELFGFFKTTAGKITIAAALLLLFIMGRMYKKKDNSGADTADN